jgi:hypothetical protein
MSTTSSRYISPFNMTVQVSRFGVEVSRFDRTRLLAGSSGHLHDIRQRPEDGLRHAIDDAHYSNSILRANNYLLVSGQRGPQLGSKIQSFIFALQSVTTRKGGSGPNQFHYDRWAVSRRTLCLVCHTLDFLDFILPELQVPKAQDCEWASFPVVLLRA